jgi:glycosyltransferase involved in cell wall biosynthesis
VHILIIHQAFASIDEPGGTRHHEFARYLAKNGHQVTIIASPISYLTGASQQAHIPWVERQVDVAPDLDGRLEILRCYTYPALHKSFVHRVISFISFMFSSFFIGLGIKQADIVWGTSPPIFQGITAWALARLKRSCFLFEVRDLWPAFAIAVGVLRNRILIRATERLEIFLYHHADLVIVNSPGFITHVKTRGAKEVALIPNGADVTMFDLQKNGTEFRRIHDLGQNFIALYAGAHGLSNDLGVVLQAASLLRDRQDIRIILLGDGKDKSKLQAQAAALELDNLIFLPPIPKDEMNEALAAADVCIAILKPVEMYKTVYPNKVFDYMAAGKPIILAIDGVIREVIEQSAGGIFTPPGDPQAMAEVIRFFADNPEKAREMGSNARRHIERYFDRTILAGELMDLLNSLEAGKNKSKSL